MSDTTTNPLAELLRRSTDRRSFMRSAAMAGALIYSADFLIACGAGNTATSTGKLTPPDPSKDYTGLGPVTFDGWAFEVDMVKRWVARFNEQNKENASFNVISGNYPSVMETQLLNKSKIDMAYVLDSDFPRWAKGKLIYDFEGWWDVEKAKADMYPSVRDYLTVDGKLYGLPYFTSVGGMIGVNQKVMDKAGIQPKDYPKTWKELYDQMRQIKKMGAAKTPWLPRWINEWFGIPIAVYEEMANQGLELVDDQGHPIFDGKTEHVRVLEDEKRAWDDGLVPTSVLTMSETDQIDGFATGQYAMSQQQIYDCISSFNDPQRSKIAGAARFVPFTSQPWGHLQLGAYVVPNFGQKGDQLARAFRIAGYAGYKDNNGEHYVAQQWAIAATLNSGYAKVLENPDVIAAYKKYLPDFDTMMPQMKDAMQGVKPLKAEREIWFTEWSTKAREVLPNVFLGSVTPSAALDTLRKEADRLVEKFKK